MLREVDNKVTLACSPEGVATHGLCRCLIPQQLLLPCRHIFVAHSYLSSRDINRSPREGQEKYPFKVMESRVNIFLSLVGKRWKWRGEAQICGIRSTRKLSAPRLIHCCTPSDAIDEQLYYDGQGSGADRTSLQSEVARSRRFGEIMAVSQKVASFAASSSFVFYSTKSMLEQLVNTSEYFSTKRRSPEWYKVSRDAFDQYMQNVDNEACSFTQQASPDTSSPSTSQCRSKLFQMKLESQ